MSEENAVVDEKKLETDRHSTLKLMFGRCGAWQKVKDGNYEEKDSIFECISSTRQRQAYNGNKFSVSQFWRTTSERFWQYDDFTFDGLAAASYLIDAHRFKIWFNPLKFYDFIYMCVAFPNLKPPANIMDNKESLKKFYEEREAEWADVCSGKNKNYDDRLSKRGFNRALYKMLTICNKNKEWDFNAWMMWSNEIIENKFLSQNVEAAMVHEMYHIIWNHLSRIEERDSYQWNLATDFAINQPVEFTPDVCVGLITDKNEDFFNRFICSMIKYLMNNDENIAKSLKENFNITDKTDFSKIKEKEIKSLYESYMTESNGWQHINKFANKSADFYYRVLLESCVIVSPQGIAGYDSHGSWSNKGETVEKDGKVYEKGAADGTEECKKADGTSPTHHSSDKERGKGGRQEHQGFDPMEAAGARREVKSTIKDALERCGVNPDDPDEIEKALKATPGMDILGALIVEWFKVRKKNWMQILKKHLTSYANPHDIDYTMSRESRVIPDFFPGKKRERGLDVVVQVDTSGSINYKDWNDFINQIEEIGRSCDTSKVRVLQVHSVIASDEFVNLRRIKKMRIKETGGTTMRLGPELLKQEKNKKLLIIFTDGYIDVFDAKDYPFKIIMFLSRGNEHNAQILQERGFQVIVQDDE